MDARMTAEDMIDAEVVHVGIAVHSMHGACLWYHRYTCMPAAYDAYMATVLMLLELMPYDKEEFFRYALSKKGIVGSYKEAMYDRATDGVRFIYTDIVALSMCGDHHGYKSKYDLSRDEEMHPFWPYVVKTRTTYVSSVETLSRPYQWKLSEMRGYWESLMAK